MALIIDWWLVIRTRGCHDVAGAARLLTPAGTFTMVTTVNVVRVARTEALPSCYRNLNIFEPCTGGIAWDRFEFLRLFYCLVFFPVGLCCVHTIVFSIKFLYSSFGTRTRARTHTRIHAYTNTHTHTYTGFLPSHKPPVFRHSTRCMRL